MLDDKQLEQLKKRVTSYVQEGVITKESTGKFVPFFITNAKNSLETARLVFTVSTKKELQAPLGFSDFNGFLWVINASYYSMFYMARALLENSKITLKPELSVHSVTFDALVYYFYLTGKLEKKLIDDFVDAEKEALVLLGKEKAKTLIDDYLHEKGKRADFTYELGFVALQHKAETSLQRAIHFNEEMRKILEL